MAASSKNVCVCRGGVTCEKEERSTRRAGDDTCRGNEKNLQFSRLGGDAARVWASIDGFAPLDDCLGGCCAAGACRNGNNVESNEVNSARFYADLPRARTSYSSCAS